MIDDLFDRRYSPQKYHCVHFVIESAREIYDLDYSTCFVGLTKSLDEALHVSKKREHQNRQIEEPVEGCIVLMTKYDNGSHVGLYYKGRVFHLPQSGAQRITIEQVKTQYKRIRFYEPNLHN